MKSNPNVAPVLPVDRRYIVASGNDVPLLKTASRSVMANMIAIAKQNEAIDRIE